MANFHDLEHALIGYLSTQHHFADDAILYYAFEETEVPEYVHIHPYYFRARIRSVKKDTFENPVFSNLVKARVAFYDIH